MSDFTLFLGKFLRQGTAIASLAPEQPLALADDRRQHRLGPGAGDRRARRGDRADHPGPGREGPAGVPGGGPGARPRLQPPAPRHASATARASTWSRETSATWPASSADCGIGQADYIVSGLPVPSFPRDLQKSLFRVVGQVLKPEGTFNQITELPWVYWRLYRKYFEEVRFVFEPRNLPPAGAYFCRGVKPIA